MGLNKRGLQWDFLLPLIVGLLVLGIIFFFFLKPLANEDTHWAQCRQSLLLRNMMPEKDLVKEISFKGTLPLKCGTQTVNINYKNVKRAEKEIAETISSCWYMVGKGEFRVFPGTGTFFGEAATPCIVCARIHLENKVRDFYTKENKIDIKKGMMGSLQGNKRTVQEYLNPEGGNKAFMYFNGWSDNGFSFKKQNSWHWSSVNKGAKVFSFPRYLEPDRGDLFVAYAEPVKGSLSLDKRGMKPYMILTQYSDFDKLSEFWVTYTYSSVAKIVGKLLEGASPAYNLLTLIKGKDASKPKSWTLGSKVCSSIESVPS